MAIITLAREVGSGGQTIAQLLAERLGYRVVGRRELVDEAMTRGLRLPAAFAAFADEQRLSRADGAETSPLYFSFGELEYGDALRGGGSATEGQPGTFLEAMSHGRRTLLWRIAAVTYELAARDRLVLIGAGGQFLLAGLPGVLRAKVVASAEVRAQRLAAVYELDRTAAMRAVALGDREQEEYNRALFDADWHDPLHWDLTLNSDGLTPEAVCAVILAALDASGGNQALSPELARALAAAGAIDRAFGDAAFVAAWPFALPSVDGVILQGDAATRTDAAAVRRVALEAIGDEKLIDQLVVVGQSASD